MSTNDGQVNPQRASNPAAPHNALKTVCARPSASISAAVIGDGLGRRSVDFRGASLEASIAAPEASCLKVPPDRIPLDLPPGALLAIPSSCLRVVARRIHSADKSAHTRFATFFPPARGVAAASTTYGTGNRHKLALMERSPELN